MCFPSLLSPVERGRTMPTKFSRSADVVMIDDGCDEIKMDTSPPYGVDLFRVDVMPVLQQLRLPPASPSLKCPLKDGCPDQWTWNRHDKSHEVRLHGPRGHSAHFHPNWSNGTAGVRGSKVLNGGRHYWEIKISQRVFGTSMMFGVATKRARLHVDAFVNLLGEDDQSWGLSHKGLLWHDGKWRQYTKPFRENEATIIGLLFDWNQGTLTYYKDGHSLGIAFSGLNKLQEEIFPTVCSTAAKTEMSLGVTMRGFTDLQDRCRAAVVARLKEENSIDSLPLPNRIKEFVKEGYHWHLAMLHHWQQPQQQQPRSMQSSATAGWFAHHLLQILGELQTVLEGSIHVHVYL